mgnify:CR=1 FL=1
MKSTLIELSFDKSNNHLQLDINLVVLVLTVIALIIIYLIVKWFRNNSKKSLIPEDIVPVEMSFKVGAASTKYNIVRNFNNIEIAHKLYIELITRKAAIEIDENNDVIVEVYNSWYSLFQITRNELKSFTGDLLNGNGKSKELIRLATDILNIGLRPHLTLYQAKFRKWYMERLEEENEKEKNDRKTPQDIQKEYIDYTDLIQSMKSVNRILTDYSEKLELFMKK